MSITTRFLCLRAASHAVTQRCHEPRVSWGGRAVRRAGDPGTGTGGDRERDTGEQGGGGDPERGRRCRRSGNLDGDTGRQGDGRERGGKPGRGTGTEDRRGLHTRPTLFTWTYPADTRCSWRNVDLPAAERAVSVGARGLEGAGASGGQTSGVRVSHPLEIPRRQPPRGRSSRGSWTQGGRAARRGRWSSGRGP